MVKKLKKIAESKQDNQLAKAVRDSAQQIWLAGLGAFAKAREERTKVFEALVSEGKTIQSRTKALAEERMTGMAEKVGEVRDMVERQATESWDRLEQVFENRVSRALGRLGMPSAAEVEALMRRVDDLTASVAALGGKVPASRMSAVRSARKAATKTAKATTTPVRPTAARKAAKGSTASIVGKAIKAKATKTKAVEPAPASKTSKPRKAVAAAKAAAPKAAVKRTRAAKARTPAATMPSVEGTDQG